MNNSQRFLRLHQVKEKIGFKKSWIYQQMRLKKFPAAIRIGSTHVAWLESDIDEWIVTAVKSTYLPYSYCGTFLKKEARSTFHGNSASILSTVSASPMRSSTY